MLYVDRAISELWKRSALIIAVKGGHVEHLNTAFNMIALHCNVFIISFYLSVIRSVYYSRLYVFVAFYCTALCNCGAVRRVQ